MKVFKGIVNVFAILVSIFLSLALLAVLICAPVTSAATSFMQTDTLQEILDQIDYADVILSVEEFSQSILDAGLDTETVETLMHSEMIGQIIEVYMESIFAVLEGNTPDTDLLAQEICSIAKAHSNELVSIIKSLLPPEIPMTDVQILTLAEQLAEGIGTTIAQALPSPESLGLDSAVIQSITALRSGLVLQVVITAAAILSVLILLFRVMRFKGFMWLGVVYMLAAALSALVAGSTGFAVPILLTELDPAIQTAVEPMVSVLTNKLWTGAGILFGLGAAFTVIFALGRSLLRKKQQATVLQEEPWAQ